MRIMHNNINNALIIFRASNIIVSLYNYVYVARFWIAEEILRKCRVDQRYFWLALCLQEVEKD